MKKSTKIILIILFFIIVIYSANNKEIDNPEENYDSYNSEIEELKSKVNDLKEELKYYKNYSEELENKNENLENDYKSAEDDIVILKNQIRGLGAEPVIPEPQYYPLTDGSSSTQDEKSSWEEYKEQRQAEENTQTPSQDTIKETSPVSQEYILNTNTHKFHKSSCSSVSQMKESNTEYFSGTRDEVISKGYEPCQRCNP